MRRDHPELPIALAAGCSQYTGQAIGERFHLVEKPYRRDALVAAVHTAGARGYVA